MELSAKPFLKLEEKMEVKKYNLAMHYGVDQAEITPEFVKTFDREKPRIIWYNSVNALDLNMKLHDAIVDWHSKLAGEIKNGIDLKCKSPNIIMCLLAMDSLNEVIPQAKGVKFTESIPYFAGAKTSRQVVEAGLDWFIPSIRHHKEMVSQMFNIKISIITSDRQTFRSKLNLVNAIFKKTFGLALKGKHVKTGNPNVFQLQLMNCFTYVDGAMTLKLPSSKLIKSHLNKPKPQVPEVLQVPEVPPGEAPLDTKPIDLHCLVDNIAHPDDGLLLARQSQTTCANIFRDHSYLQTSVRRVFFPIQPGPPTFTYSSSHGLMSGCGCSTFGYIYRYGKVEHPPPIWTTPMQWATAILI